MDRRNFVKLSALSAAATLLPEAPVCPAWRTPAPGGPLKKAVLITMLPKQMSYLDRFKLAVDVGFEGIEAQTITDPREADQIKEASVKAKIPIHSVMNMGHWEWPLSSPHADEVA